jgi:hypothetical protein
MEGPRSKRVLIIGAGGVFGALTARAFQAAGWKVTCGARRLGPRQTYLDLDLPDSIPAALDGQDLVINTVPHPQLHAERLVLERGGVLINTSAIPAAAGRSLRATAGGARGTVLMNAGLAPGVTTIVAADLLHTYPDAEEIQMVFTLSGTTPRGPASADFVHRGLTVVPRHRTIAVSLPDPFGVRCCLGFGEGDAGWLGGVAEGRVVRLYICITEPGAHERVLELNRAGAMVKLPWSLIRSRDLPADGTVSNEPVAHWIAANRGERRLAARTVRCRGDFWHAARSTAVFADHLLAREPRGGCFGPEEMFTPGELAADLRAVGITIVDQPDTARQSGSR